MHTSGIGEIFPTHSNALLAHYPVFEHISTSYAERQNLSMRMAMRRMTHLINAFSKKVENLQHATSLYFMYSS